jgi:hypothetical protein
MSSDWNSFRHTGAQNSSDCNVVYLHLVIRNTIFWPKVINLWNEISTNVASEQRPLFVFYIDMDML